MQNHKKYMINKDNASWKEVDGEIVLINFETTYYYSLNQTGAFIWKQMIDRECTLSEIVHSVSKVFGQAPELVRNDVKQLLNQLEEENLVLIED